VQLTRGEAASAEPLIRDAIRIRRAAPQAVPNRRRILPEDDWSIGAAGSLLGASLTALRRYDEAEAALLEARSHLGAASAPGDVRATETRLIDLYTAWGKPAEADRYRALRASDR
jgi:hypothetical protein